MSRVSPYLSDTDAIKNYIDEQLLCCVVHLEETFDCIIDGDKINLLGEEAFYTQILKNLVRHGEREMGEMSSGPIGYLT